MQNLNDKINKKITKVPYKSYKYEEIGFTVSKINRKYVAICKMCKRVLGNTAYARLKGHRNICKMKPVEKYVPYTPINNQTLVPNPIVESFYMNSTEPVSLECTSQTSDDSSRVAFNIVTPNIESVGSQNGRNLNDPYTHHYNPILDEENQINLKILEVLLLIKLHKHKLFESEYPNETGNEAWLEVLRKAQSLGLAPENAQWSYAKHSLYPIWKHRTLTKMDSNELNTKLDIVDLTILQIENLHPQDRSFHLGDELFQTNGQRNDLENISNKQSEISNLESHSSLVEKSNSISTQTIDEMYEAELHLKLLQCEAMEIQNYKSSLEALELERKLKVPPSKFTVKFFVPNSKTYPKVEIPEQKPAQNVVKIELDD